MYRSNTSKKYVSKSFSLIAANLRVRSSRKILPSDIQISEVTFL